MTDDDKKRREDEDLDETPCVTFPALWWPDHECYKYTKKDHLAVDIFAEEYLKDNPPPKRVVKIKSR